MDSPNLNTSLPLYQQVSERLIRDIAAGRLLDGVRLPPEREMAQELGVAVGTLRKSLADLEGKGLLERVQGSGNYIKAKPQVDSIYAFFRLELIKGGGLPTAEVLSNHHGQAPEGATFDQGTCIRRLRFLDQQAIALEEIWIDADLGALAQDDLHDSLYLTYQNQLGVTIASVEDRIGVGQVPDWSEARFDLSPSTSCGFVERISWDSSKRAVEFSRTWFDTSKARYVSRMGKG